MIVAIAGDMIGSIYEWDNIKTTDFPLFQSKCFFTDDTVLTIAVADCLLSGGDYATAYTTYGRRYPNRGYGGRFSDWLRSEETQPYNSFGNGSAMRVSPVGFAFDTLDEVLSEARRSAEATHNHPEGIKGAQATAAAIFWGRTGRSKEELRELISTYFGYDLDRTLDEIRPDYQFNVTCQKTVPEAIIAFLESENLEDALRRAISLGGDSDTLACITGGIAQGFYKKVPETIVEEVRSRLTPELLAVVDRFNAKYGLM